MATAGQGWHRAAQPRAGREQPLTSGAHIESVFHLNTAKFWIFPALSIGSGLALPTQGSECFTHTSGAAAGSSSLALHGARLMISTMTCAPQPHQLPDTGEKTLFVSHQELWQQHT